jgi:hypothetical protein
MTQALASGNPGEIETFCRKSAWTFRQEVLRVFDETLKRARTSTSPAPVRFLQDIP